ncbi:MAG: hypothetical protein HY645_07350 [Acidobacteria bacterium]|nr:hypothetical protein [Acidobacteriota bacterium]
MKAMLALLVIAGTLGISIIYAGYHAFEDSVFLNQNTFRDSDFSRYLDLYFGEGRAWNTGFRYRVLVPYLARLLPDVPPVFFNPDRPPINPTQAAAMKFAFIAFLFLLGTCVVLYHLIQGFGVPARYAALGAPLFLGLKQVVWISGYPSVESAYCFFFSLAVLAVQRQKIGLLVLATTVGVLVKELVLIVIALILFAPFAWSRRLWLVAAVAPALVIHFGLRLWLAPHPDDHLLSGEFVKDILPTLIQLFSLNSAVQLFITFGFLWVPCFSALRQGQLPAMLSRWSWFMPILLVVAVAFGEPNVGPKMTSAFPVVIPMAVIGLSDWLRQSK